MVSRRRWLAAASAMLVDSGCSATAAPRRQSDHWLIAGVGFSGARRIKHMDAGGNVQPQDIGEWVPLIAPVALAPTQLDIYVADAGHARLLRYDRTLDALAVMPGVQVTPLTRLRGGGDGSVYVLNPGVAEIRRYTRGGQPLPALRPQRATSHYSDFVVDPLSGKAYVVDSAHLSIDEIRPLGNIALEFQALPQPGPIASDGRHLFVAGSRCGCVTEFGNGRALRTYGAGQLRQPRALEHQGGRLWAIDSGMPGVCLVHAEGVEVISPMSLGLLQADALGGTQGQLWIADAAGRRVGAFHINPRRSRA